MQDLIEMAENQIGKVLTNERLEDLHRNLCLGLNEYRAALRELSNMFNNKVGTEGIISFKNAHYDAFEILRKMEPENWEHEKCKDFTRMKKFETWRTDFLAYLFMLGVVNRMISVYPNAVPRMTQFAQNAQ
ncbi:MAG: hypothetical protein EOP45_18290 [Sphingobacteriaceae bacterium]|nr:MAG: hypothetical protein EOP45_18290 [Sphingobacteriaceae bacterium]